MTSTPGAGSSRLGPPPSACAEAEDLVQALVRTLRIRTLYQPNNPIHREFSQALVERFEAYLAAHQSLQLEVREHELVSDGEPVYRDEGTRESLPFTLHRDGIREVTFFEGIAAAEIFAFLETVKLDPARDAEAGDVLSRLWERDFVHVRYRFVDLFLEGGAVALPGPAPSGTRELGFAPVDETYTVADPAGERAVDGRSLLDQDRQDEIVKITPDDFDPTLYFLERDEVRRLREEIDREKERSLLVDYMELLRELVLLNASSADVDPLEALAELCADFFTNDNLAAVVRILDLLAELAGCAQLSAAKHQRVQALAAAILSPESVARVAAMLEEEGSEERPLAAYLERAAKVDFGSLIERLGDVKRLAQREEILAPLAAAAAGQRETLHRLFRHPDPTVVKNAVFLSGRAANRESLEALEEPFRSPDAEVRIEAIHALKAYRSTRAMDMLVEAVSDPDKLVRYYALRSLISFNYRPSLPAVVAAIRDRDFAGKDLTEKKLFFEAYGRFAGAEAIPYLRGILARKSLLRKGQIRDLKVCAVTALATIGGDKARAVLQEHRSDPQAEVREACEQALVRR